MSETKRNVPKLRFPGFTEDWEQRKLSDVLIERNEQQVETREYPLMSFVQGLGVTPKGERYDRSFLVLDQSKKYKRTELGDFIYSSNNLETGSIGINKTGKAVISPVYSIFQGVSIGDSQFIGIMSLLPRFIAKMIRFRQGVVYGQWRIHETDFLDISVLIPSVDERTKITQLILSIEELITLHQRKLDNLKLKKKALLQKLFPKNGDRYPELRFPGFTDAWEQRKLGDFTNQINNFVNPEDAKLPLWSLTAEAGLIEKSDRYERDFLVKKKDQFKRIETNTLVYNPMNITIGSIDIYTGLYPIAVSGYYVSIVYDKNIDTDFLKEVLLLPSSLKMYKNYATGSLIERQRVQYPTFSKLQLLLPNLDEQKAIGQFFKSLNLDITLHQRKLDHLQLQKKALLQQIFV